MAKYQTKSVLNDEPFKNRQAAFSWLLDNGYKVAKSKWYADCQDGNPPVNPDGGVDRNSVICYAQSISKATFSNSDYQARLEKAVCEKAESDARVAFTKAEHAEKRASDFWANREEVYTVWAGLMGAIYNGFQHNFSASSHNLIQSVNGDQSRRAQIGGFIEQIINDTFNEVAMSKKIEATFYSMDDSGDRVYADEDTEAEFLLDV